MDKARSTIYDVAREAGVAISTVSRVLNGSDEVSDETRAKVMAAIEKLQFRPARTAKMLAQKQSDSLAVAVPSFTSQFYNEILKGVKDCLREHDIDLLLCNLGSASPHQTLWRFLNRGAVDGLLLASLPVNEKLRHELLRLRAPVVLIGTSHPEFDSFYWDDVKGAYAAVSHLIERGHKKIGMINSHAWSFNTDDRIAGYRQALEEHGLTFDPELIQTGDTLKHAGFSEEAGNEALLKLLAIAPDMTAVFASGDVQAIGALYALRNMNRNAPEDVAIVGYDGIKFSKYIGLTTVDQHMQSVGHRATELVLERRRSNSYEPVSEPIVPELVIRESSTLRLEQD